MALLRSYLSDDQLQDALLHLGIIDPRSRAYSHLMLDLEPAPMPQREFYSWRRFGAWPWLCGHRARSGSSSLNLLVMQAMLNIASMMHGGDHGEHDDSEH